MLDPAHLDPAQEQPFEPEVKELPPYLEGLVPPVTVADALTYAEEHGAPEEALLYIESLAGAVFTSEEGMRNAFASVQNGEFPPSDPDEILVGQDGTSS